MKAVYTPLYKNDGLLPIVHDYPDISFTVAMTADELAPVIGDADILITNNRVYDKDVARLVCNDAKKLRWIQFSTSGIERGLEFGLPPGIPVTNAGGVRGPTVAEHAVTLLLASFRQLRAIDRAQATRKWARMEINPLVRTLEGATLVIVGLGSIGRDVARKVKGFDMNVIAVTRSTKATPHVDELVPREHLKEALGRADAVLLSIPVEPDTLHMIGEAELKSMKPNAWLINVARGELIDQAVLIRALEEGWIGGAALDVTDPEPLPAESGLWGLDNALISPHVSASGNDAYLRFTELFGENLRRFKSGDPLMFRIDWEKGETSPSYD